MLHQRLWAVSELYYPEETSTGYVLTGCAEGLAGSFDLNVLQLLGARAPGAGPREARRGLQSIIRLAFPGPEGRT